MTFEFAALCAISILAFCNIAIFYGFYSYLTEIGIAPGWRGPLLSLEPLTALVARPFLGRYLTLNNGVRFMPVDVRRAFLAMLPAPLHGYGKHLNPCVDCKILMLRHARGLLGPLGARFLVSGEVLGQRPMSQRADTLNLIRKEAGVADVLLRPLSAQKLGPTPMCGWTAATSLRC